MYSSCASSTGKTKRSVPMKLSVTSLTRNNEERQRRVDTRTKNTVSFHNLPGIDDDRYVIWYLLVMFTINWVEMKT